MSLAQVGLSTAIVYGNGPRAQQAEGENIGKEKINEDLRSSSSTVGKGLQHVREREYKGRHLDGLGVIA